MSGLFGSLSTGVKALNAQSRAVETASRNIANVNNADYARQRVLLGDRGTVVTAQGVESMGVEAMQTEQLRDALMDRQVTREVSVTQSLNSQQSALAKAQAALGQSIDRTTGATGTTTTTGNGVAGSLSDYFTAFQSFAATPTDVGTRQTLLQKAEVMADAFHVADTRLDQLQGDLTTQIETDVGGVNSLLSSIAALNGQINSLETNAPGSAVDLRDQRQAKLEELAKKINFESRPSTTASGEVDVFVRDAGGAEVSLVANNIVSGPVTFSGSTISAGNPSTAINVTGGSIAGNLTVRDGAVQTLRDQLDTLAQQLVTSVNAAYNPTGATGDFFDASSTTAASIKLATGLTYTNLKASDGGASGDNTIAAAVAKLASKSFSTTGGDGIDGTFTQAYASAVSGLGAAASAANSKYTDQQNIESIVRGQRDSVSGVSMDEELADLVKYQRSFQASSRVIAVIDELLETVVNLGR